MNTLNFIKDWLTNQFPSIITAILILVVGWIVALILASIVRGAFKRTGISGRIARFIKADEDATGAEVTKWIGRIVFYLAMFFVLVAFFQHIGLPYIAEPLNAFLMNIFAAAPLFFGAVVILLVAWLLATVLRIIIMRVLETAKFDERLSEQVEDEETKKISLTQQIGNIVYWITFLLFIPAVLSTLRLEGLLVPVQNMLESILSYLPNILGAGLILVLGWFGAKILKRFLVSLLSSVGVDRITERDDVASYFGKNKPSEIIGIIAYALVMLFVIIGALNALSVEAITAPASAMLEMILTALPAIFAALLILTIAFLVGRILVGLITGLLSAIGFDQLLVRLGIAREVVEGKKSPSEIAGYLVLVAIMLFAAIEAAGVLGFTVLSSLIAALTVLLGRVVVSLVIFGIGLYLAGLTKEVVLSSGSPHADLLSKLARIAVLILAGAIALQQLGVADEIIIIAFGVLIGAIALTGVIAFGLGGRDVASRELSSWVDDLKRKE
jgi:hypothetical protein